MIRQSVAPEATPKVQTDEHLRPTSGTEDAKPKDETTLQPLWFRWPWLLALAAFGSEAILLPILFQPAAFVNFFVFPVLTLVLAYKAPIPWGWAAVSVALLHGANYLGYWFGGGTFVEDDLAFSLIFYIANALLVSLVAFFRMRRLRRVAV